MTIVNHGNTKEILSRRTFSGSIWQFITRFSLQVMSLIQVTILGRLLSPDDFGLMGIATIAILAISTITYTGYEFALVQKPELNPEDIHTAWWIMLIQRVAICVLLLVLAYPLARFYKTISVLPILLVMAFAQVLIGLSNPTASLFQRQLKFRSIFYFQFISSFVGFIIGIIFALVFRNVWALVVATVSTYVAQLICSYFMIDYRPRMIMNKDSLKFFLGYGQWMLGSAILWFLFSQGTTAASGRMFGVAALGIYQMASRFALLPTTQFIDVITGSVFSSVAIIQGERDRLRQAFLRILCLSSIYIFGITVLIALFLPPIFILILGEQWVESAQLIPLIAVAGGLSALIRIASPIFLGVGIPRYQFSLDLVQTTIMLILIVPAGRMFGISGLPVATIIGAIVALPIWWIGLKRALTVNIRQLLVSVYPALFGSMMIFVIFLINKFITIQFPININSFIWQIIIIFIATLVYALAIWFIVKLKPDNRQLQEAYDLITTMLVEYKQSLSDFFGRITRRQNETTG